MLNLKMLSADSRKKLRPTSKILKKTDSLFVPADKTTNFYKMDPPSYNQLLEKNITKNYKKISLQTVSSVESQSKSIANKLNLTDRINTTANRESFITLKDHKPNFENNPTCRLSSSLKSVK